MAKHIIGERYVNSKRTTVFLGIIVFVITVGLGAFGVAMIYVNYNLELNNYHSYPSEYDSMPKLPIGWMIVLAIVTLLLATFFLWLILYVDNKNATKNKDVIIYDESKNELLVLHKKEYYIFSADNIIDVSSHDFVIVPAGYVLMPVKTGYGPVHIKVKNGNETCVVKSDPVKNVDEVIKKIKEIIH